MASLVFSILRDLYVVLLIILLIEQIPGNDLLHDTTRKGIITVTVIIIVAKLVQPLIENGAGPGRTPCRQKKTTGGSDSLLEWASAEMRGWRPAMEDATCVATPLSAPLSNQALFAVFDGHGGAQVSQITSVEFPKVLAACASSVVGHASAGASDGSGKESSSASEATAAEPAEPAAATAGEDAAAAEGEEGRCALPSQIGKSLHLAMLTMDSFLRKGGDGMPSRPPQSSLGLMEACGDKKNAFSLVGSTAVVALVEYGETSSSSETGSNNNSNNGNGTARKLCRIAVANCGDSRAVVCRGGKAVGLSEDHKPELKAEEERIRKAGGHVALVGPCHRIDGWGLNLSRALGDFHYKARTDLPPEQQKVIAVPEIQTLELTEEDEFLLLGCDGIFELNSSQKAVDIVRRGLSAGLSVGKAVEELVDKSCSPDLMKTRGQGGDNCSAIVVRFLRAGSA
mmetsp:Transcript_102715/g.257521  ORF Transcript_102715/g.257521 Transcript_102715/m.257521 type:complete len:455 (-) Transcript_102715:191-1555(-)